MLLGNLLVLVYIKDSVVVTRLMVLLAVPDVKPLAISRSWMNWVVVLLCPIWNPLCTNRAVLRQVCLRVHWKYRGGRGGPVVHCLIHDHWYTAD